MNLDDIQGWFDFQNIYDRMAEEVPDGGTIIELGVWKGKSLIYLAQAVKKTGKKVLVVGIDSFKHADWDGYSTIQRLDREKGEQRTVAQQCRDNIKAAGVADCVKIIEADSIAAAKLFADDYVDFIFIDDTHTDDHIKAEIAAWLPKMKRPTWIGGHDYPGGISVGVAHHFPHVWRDGSSWIAELK